MADRSMKDKEMASYLKAHGVTRTHLRCPMCHKVVQLGNPFYAHLSSHAGGRREEASNAPR